MVIRTPAASLFVVRQIRGKNRVDACHFSPLDPSESDKQDLMEKTKMSLSQITVWFTNARVKMRKENKLPLNLYAKKKKKKQQQQHPDESFHLDDTLSPPFSSHNLSLNGETFELDRWETSPVTLQNSPPHSTRNTSAMAILTNRLHRIR